jgi:formylglycine-generating enzyme required for sulfatase activity
MNKFIVSALAIMVVLCFSNLPLNVEQVNSPKDGLPVNVTISYAGSTVTINWDEVTNAVQYYIYSQDDPYGEYTLIDSTEATTWNGNFVQNKKFFYVTTELVSEPDRFVLIPGGKFQMGDSFSEGSPAERPVHSVTLNSFYMGKYEVTQSEWSQYMPAEDWSSWGTGDNYPAYYVRWYELIKYCNLRSMAEGLTPVYTINSSTNPADWGDYYYDWDAPICNWRANGYRLPSEAEWEYAARGGLSGQRFPNGATISHSTNGDTQANYNAAPGSYTYDVSPTTGCHPSYGTSSAPVGSFPPNGYGLYDMAGNLWEWCWDWYSSSYYSSSPSSNPTGPKTGSDRVRRGGDRGLYAPYCRVAFRLSSYPDVSGNGIGFRLARTP